MKRLFEHLATLTAPEIKAFIALDCGCKTASQIQVTAGLSASQVSYAIRELYKKQLINVKSIEA